MKSSIIPKVITTEPIALKAWAQGRMIYLELVDGRVIGFPADRYRKLKAANESELKKIKLRLEGKALRWEEIDEDLTVLGILEGRFQLPLD